MTNRELASKLTKLSHLVEWGRIVLTDEDKEWLIKTVEKVEDKYYIEES